MEKMNLFMSLGSLAGSNAAPDRRPPAKRPKGAEVIASSASRGPHMGPSFAGGDIPANGPASRAATLVPTDRPAVLGGNRHKPRITTPQVRTVCATVSAERLNAPYARSPMYLYVYFSHRTVMGFATDTEVSTASRCTGCTVEVQCSGDTVHVPYRSGLVPQHCTGPMSFFPHSLAVWIATVVTVSCTYGLCSPQLGQGEIKIGTIR
jgi:hypothetical protein